MKVTRARDLLATGVVVGILVNLFLLVDYDALPPLPLLAGISLLVLAAIEVFFAQSLRARLAGREGTKPVPALVAARAVALAKASSVLGAIMAGAWAGILAFILPRYSRFITSAGDANSSWVGLVSAGALIAAALWLEHSCKAPQDRDDRGEQPPSH
ncbi:MAG TPA: DUF3180 domain-containing protein [Pseudonocardiaceae bacterium]|nr:DUF3180 domain-containing protein [Pseudonocardiaceae bacterium]